MQICLKHDLHSLNALYESKNSWESKTSDPLMRTVFDAPTFKHICSRSKKRIPIMERTLNTINIQLLHAAAFGEKYIKYDVCRYLWSLPVFGQYVSQLKVMGYTVEFLNSLVPSHHCLLISWENNEDRSMRRAYESLSFSEKMKLMNDRDGQVDDNNDDDADDYNEERDYREIAMINQFIREDSMLRNRQLRFDMHEFQFNSSRVRKYFHDLAAAGYDVSLHPDAFYVIRWHCRIDPKYNSVKQSKLSAY